jgi:uncharacterized membrane protein
MSLLIAGLLLWSLAHLFKRLFPGARTAMTEALGAGPSKGVFALLLVAATLLLIIGYRGAPLVAVWTPPALGVHLNNLLMLGAVALFGMGNSKGRARAWLRHPMLTGVVVWAVAHLIVNGDLASILLFGGLLAWALAEMALINLREPTWVRPTPGPVSGDIRLAVIALVAYAAIGGIHAWLGVWPFGR